MTRQHHDRPFAEIVAIGNRMLEHEGYTQVFLKWTCPKCGDRCMSDVPNEYAQTGYIHTERENGQPCGHHYQGENGYGITGVISCGDGGDVVKALHAILGKQPKQEGT